jgi:uncharacterized protein (TIGR01777 family)
MFNKSPSRFVMNIAITGSSGFIGSALRAHFEQAGYRVTRVLRMGRGGQAAQGSVFWDLARPGDLAAGLEGVDAVIHLAGAGISDHRWTAAYKQEILESRVQGTRGLSEALGMMKKKPQVLISASAVGIYGPRGTERINESAVSGSDFLAKVCRNWEELAEPARKAGIRVVHPRISLVLGTQGGALKKMLLPFKLGLGGVIGTGKQIYSWITLQDLCEAFAFLVASPTAQGPYNLAAPGACSNLEYTKALGRALKRPTLFPMPAFAARLAFGEMADALLLSGQNTWPGRLLGEGFKFKSESIDKAFEQVFKAKELPL